MNLACIYHPFLLELIRKWTCDVLVLNEPKFNDEASANLNDSLSPSRLTLASCPRLLQAHLPVRSKLIMLHPAPHYHVLKPSEPGSQLLAVLLTERVLVYATAWPARFTARKPVPLSNASIEPSFY